MSTVENYVRDKEEVIAGALRVRLPPSLRFTENQFFEFCALNRDVRIERNARGEVTIMPPAGWASANRNARITSQLVTWAERDGSGAAADSSAGYMLPNTAVREPDASWISNARLATVPAEQKERFLPLCPDFVVELRSPSDRLPILQAKMAEYMANGARLGWLIDPANRQVFVYRQGHEAERLDAPDRLSGDPPMAGFELRMEGIW